ncbi:hypothetical protein CLAFUW4_04785 [Fulvia fulva]|uniref:Uncharacterized protein n=1 Tax=Passalora fulva TaxID=5499 RepID=A0A9Q8UUA5_PASFU|nr:uncharacterized protein CLAFUR5_12115 [Fulvia fulva]KAK4626274.1 hypothetical protein CLAFUR4_04771 [Fulvia fulva]KAK4628172.1 hypothetical protein CLAFUR0_04775 [Fulvia fulva]UJO22749.1 hypothetical protein CLAFUR5_12115 [Fulvia fulva]WPV13815.1 hypothetical protein CLAFUW4_04785 [Fulvia fulva]WPV28208.1 hypothetical protein CLAFUW7_04779 [Fulvia fulva]
MASPLQHDSENLHSPALPQSDSPRGLGSGSKQSRRLQLRNAGFRAPTLAPRKVTPKSITSSSATYSSNSAFQLSDAENISPTGKGPTKDRSSIGAARKSSGILQDIGNSSTTRQANHARSRVTSTKYRLSEGNGHVEDPRNGTSSPPAPSSITIRPRSKRLRASMGKPRRSGSSETRKYVDHLEEQLSEAQAQLSAINSPTITRAESSRVRTLNAETKHLQDELAAWEEKFEHRVQGELDKHFETEAGLRARVRTLEDATEEARFKIQELEMQLDSADQTMKAAEVANVNLEKRLEIMSELLATSPTKIDLHAETPFRRRQSRPKSMLPRFPTAGSLAQSPERPAYTQPTSPSPPHIRYSPGVPMSPVNLNFSPEVPSSDEESGFSHASFGANFAPPPSNLESRPRRRMRRFGAGSMGPKPLILPSTSNCEDTPASAAPRLERDEEELHSAFPFPPPFSMRNNGSPQPLRRRSSTEARALSMSGSSSSPRSDPSHGSRRSHGYSHSVTLARPVSGTLRATPRDFSSIGSAVGTTIGRNLMEELTAARTSEEDSSSEPSSEDAREQSPIQDGLPLLLEEAVPAEPDTALALLEQSEGYVDVNLPPSEPPESRFVSGSSTAVALSTAVGTIKQPPPIKLYPTIHSRSSSRSLAPSSQGSLSTLDSLRTIFSDMFRSLRSPAELARHLVQRAQSHMQIPRPLLIVQWWLVGILLGPMAKRRFLARSTCCDSNKETTPLLEDESQEQEQIAYGTAYQTPQSSPLPPRARSAPLVAGKGKKRATSAGAKGTACGKAAKHCPNHPKRFKHSPWLWLKFSITLAFAVGVAFKDGPSSLLKEADCHCRKRSISRTGRRARGDDEVLSTPNLRSPDETVTWRQQHRNAG